jgi:hypothetical protein
VPLPGPAANRREPLEVERLRLAFPTLASILFRIAAKFEDARLIGMPWKANVRESLAQLCQKPLGFLPMLASRHKVIGKANQDNLSVRLLLSPLPDPQVECVVEIAIRDWAGTPTRIPKSPVRRSRSAPPQWHAGRSYLPARERRVAEAHPVYPPSGGTPCAQALLGRLLA